MDIDKLTEQQKKFLHRLSFFKKFQLIIPHRKLKVKTNMKKEVLDQYFLIMNPNDVEKYYTAYNQRLESMKNTLPLFVGTAIASMIVCNLVNKYIPIKPLAPSLVIASLASGYYFYYATNRFYKVVDTTYNNFKKSVTSEKFEEFENNVIINATLDYTPSDSIKHFSEQSSFAKHLDGAIGYSCEHDLHLWMKRAWALAASFGDAAHHRERVARGLLTA